MSAVVKQIAGKPIYERDRWRPKNNGPARTAGRHNCIGYWLWTRSLDYPCGKRVGSSGSVTALDLQPEMLRRAKEQARTNNCDNIHFIRGGIADSLLPVNSFDRALLVTVLGEVLQKKPALAEIYNSLRPNGMLSVTEALPDHHDQTYGKVCRLAVSTGFVIGSRWLNGLAHATHFIKPVYGNAL